MFENIFKYPATVLRHRRAPLADERARFLQHLAECGYAKTTLSKLDDWLIRIIRLLRLRHGLRITPKEIERVAARLGWLKNGCRDCRRENFISLSTRWLRFLGWLKEDEEHLAHQSEVERFATWMGNERGLSPATIKLRVWHLRHFFRWYEARRKRLGNIRVSDIDGFLQQSGETGWSRRSVVIRAYALRAFLRFAGTQGWCSPHIADAIQGPRIYPQESLPSGPSWEDVKRLLNYMDTDRPADIRERAIAMLLAIYGLRIGEVAGLCLEDIDWTNNRIVIRRSKGGRPRSYPLSPPVGHAVIRYLREVRPKCGRREVFLTLRAPFGPARHIYRRLLERMLALKIKSPHYGPHALRHACAAHLLNEGFSLKEIGDHLGHSSLQSTRTYAKIDLCGLGRVAAFDLGGLA